MTERTVHWVNSDGVWWEGTLLAIVNDGYRASVVGVVVTENSLFIAIPIHQLQDGPVEKA